MDVGTIKVDKTLELDNLIFKVNSKKEQLAVQRFLFTLDIIWNGDTTSKEHTYKYAKVFVVSNKKMRYANDYQYIKRRFGRTHKFCSIVNNTLIIEEIKYEVRDYVYSKSLNLVGCIVGLSNEGKSFVILNEGTKHPVNIDDIERASNEQLKSIFKVGDVVKQIHKDELESIHMNTKMLVVDINENSLDVRYVCPKREYSRKVTINLHYLAKVGSYLDYIKKPLSIGSKYFLKGTYEDYRFSRPHELRTVIPAKFSDELTTTYKLYSEDTGHKTVVEDKVFCEAAAIPLSNQLFSRTLFTKIYKIYNTTKNSSLKSLLKTTIMCAVGKEYSKDSISNLTINSKKELTYLPKGKESEGSSEWSIKNRQAGKYGKVFRKVLTQIGLKPTAKDIEDLVNLLKSNVVDGNFRVIEGEEIAEIYSNPSIANRTGSLSGSCMNGKPEHYFELYVDNAKMVVLEDGDGLLMGRAILWTTECGTPFMDRIYASDANIHAFLEWARDNKYWAKARQSHEDPTSFINVEGEVVAREFAVALKKECDYYPYMDTFKYTDDFGELSLSNDNSYNNYVLKSTGGNYVDNK